jgi:hypothetical protein
MPWHCQSTGPCLLPTRHLVSRLPCSEVASGISISKEGGRRPRRTRHPGHSLGLEDSQPHGEYRRRITQRRFATEACSMCRLCDGEEGGMDGDRFLSCEVWQRGRRARERGLIRIAWERRLDRSGGPHGVGKLKGQRRHHDDDWKSALERGRERNSKLRHHTTAVDGGTGHESDFRRMTAPPGGPLSLAKPPTVATSIALVLLADSPNGRSSRAGAISGPPFTTLHHLNSCRLAGPLRAGALRGNLPP